MSIRILCNLSDGFKHSIVISQKKNMLIPKEKSTRDKPF